MQDITEWLANGRDFTKGVELYNRYGSNLFFKNTLLPAGPTLYNKEKLLSDLQQIAQASPASKPIAPPPQPVVKPVNIITITETDKAKNHLKYLDLITQRNNLLKVLDRNMAALVFSDDKTVLHETAKQILRLAQRKTEIWALIDYYNENQCFPPVTPAKVVSREKQMQLIYRSICKARKRLKDPKYPLKAKTQKLIDKKLKQLEELKNL